MNPTLWMGLAAAAALNLDRQAFGQLGFSRPLVSASLVGMVCGRPMEGMSLGLWTEMLWLNRAPLGGHIPPNGGLAASAAVVGLASFLLIVGDDPEVSGPQAHAALLALVFALTPPLAWLMTLIELTSRRRAAVLARDFEAALAAGYDPSPLRLQISSLASTLGLSLAFLVLGAVLTRGLLYMCLAYMPPWGWAVFSKGAVLAPLAGVAFMSDTMVDRRQGAFALALMILILLGYRGLFR
ncbi:MAG: PTS sugar transporter subunit IIC [Deltaproteobacteria bacterium]|nr:PTS sugar transporter subunit IIC [Deltaproteobacteria bacterium]